VSRRDPLRNPEQLIRRVYAYVSYRIGAGADAEDVTSTVFERALLYRDSYDPRRGAPLPWLLGIARRCIADLPSRSESHSNAHDDLPGSADFESETVERLNLHAAVRRLDERSRDLLALRYGGDLTAREIGKLVGLKTNAVEVALHRALARLRAELDDTRGHDLPSIGAHAPLARPADRPGLT
jgi:RNA polymerase sigma factor (sigma-70 family)